MNISSLILIILIAGAFLWYIFSIVYHFVRFGIGKEPKIIVLVFFIGSFLLLATTIIFFTQIDWKAISEFLLNPFQLK
ncbi:MAG TPA: hypothetical protein PLL80_02975 [Candidatus Pacearchaeota archaeon]|nr:hypothetical protein [Candidatus Pacearchaeota archaeon]HPO75536.1 hypothetical protein [Candidatus Pacearchaeota archaeon]